MVRTVLQSVGKELVELGDLGGDAKVNGTVADLNNEATDDLGVDLNIVSVHVAQGAELRPVRGDLGDSAEVK